MILSKTLLSSSKPDNIPRRNETTLQEKTTRQKTNHLNVLTSLIIRGPIQFCVDKQNTPPPPSAQEKNPIKDEKPSCS